jgi:hypothetical protein
MEMIYAEGVGGLGMKLRLGLNILIQKKALLIAV